MVSSNPDGQWLTVANGGKQPGNATPERRARTDIEQSQNGEMERWRDGEWPRKGVPELHCAQEDSEHFCPGILGTRPRKDFRAMASGAGWRRELVRDHECSGIVRQMIL
ncbi:hypothetical protein E4U53_007398 [Claviceps sorghi]|nr:hypothetical protein E4U53_007398 [Claviceps sorghi]